MTANPKPGTNRVVEMLPLGTLRTNDRNPKAHDLGTLDASVSRFGVIDPIVLDSRTNTIISGHGRAATLRAMRDRGESPPDGVQLTDGGEWLVPVATGWASRTDTEAHAALIALNRTTELGGWVDDELLGLLDDLSALGDEGFAGVGYDAVDLEELRARVDALDDGDDDDPDRDPDDGEGSYTPGPTLADRFLVPPFSVLNAREGVWQERKRRWLALGIQSEVGRVEADGSTLGAVQTNLDGVDAERYGRKAPVAYDSQDKLDAFQRRGRKPSPRSYKGQESLYDIKPDAAPRPRSKAQALPVAGGAGVGMSNTITDPGARDTVGAGVSIFDPVLCELAYRWFSPPRGHVLDPFAGGSVRGIVAAMLGRDYTGIELRAEQVAANHQQASDLLPGNVDAGAATWHTGDSLALLPTLDSPPADLLFSCPPYADLEVYSNDPADISAMPYDEFLTAYRGIIAAAAERLAPNRFAVWVVSEVRDKRGNYRGLVPDTIRAFEDAGLRFYNEMILVTPAGSLPIRAGKAFDAGRKVGRTHQNVLVFLKGDAKAATEACGAVEVAWPVDDNDPDAGDAGAGVELTVVD